jgi:SAM-dependent methyltransferase
MADEWREVFEQTYASPASAVQERVWRTVFGAEYPDGIDPYSFVSRTELGRIAAESHATAGDTLVDVGCGRGGAGLWVAGSTGAGLIGIDIAEAALVDARSRAAALGLDALFRRGEFEATGLAEGVADAIMSIDAFIFTPDKAAAYRELRRIARDGARLVMTSWDYHRQPVGRPPQVADHRPLAAAAGWGVLAYEETDDWRGRIERTAAGLIEAAEELAAETNADVDDVRAELVVMNATIETMSRRFLLVAEAR